MEIMDKELTVPKWGIIIRLKISKNLFDQSAQFAQKLEFIDEKRYTYWMSVVITIYYRQ